MFCYYVLVLDNSDDTTQYIHSDEWKAYDGLVNISYETKKKERKERKKKKNIIE